MRLGDIQNQLEEKFNIRTSKSNMFNLIKKSVENSERIQKASRGYYQYKL